jgi:hypothetical protein
MFQQPLNLPLFRQLQARFGEVRIASEGEQRRVQYFPSPQGGGRMSATAVISGEQYRVSCPFCGDLRQRLYISYVYGTFDPVTRSRNFRLWCCHNEQCQEDPENSERLRSWVEVPIGARARQAVAAVGVASATNSSTRAVLSPIKLPGGVLRVDRLTVNHPAATYLRDERRHNLQYLSEMFGISYCHEALPEFRQVQSRIIIPIVQNGMLVGWQARHVGELNWKAAGIPKYFGKPGMPKRLMLYNYDNAKQWPFVVLVEGVTSVWRIGGPAVALLGKTLTSQQQSLVNNTWAGKPVILMLDPDAREQMEGIIREMQRLGRVMVIPIWLPQGTDPDNFDHGTNLAMIRAHARQAGFELPEW